MIGGTSLQRICARLVRDPRDGADERGSVGRSAGPAPVADPREGDHRGLSSLAQLAALERLRGTPEDLCLGPLLREVVCDVPRLLVEVVACDVEVQAHDENLRTVLRNLLMNVRDHATGHAVVSCRTEGRRVLVTVTDHGPGLRPMQLATLFQRGARGPDSRGLGLGLHVARMLCRRQGGDLRLVRGVGGCTFEIVLWAAGGPDEAEAIPRQRSGAPAPTPSSGEAGDA